LHFCSKILLDTLKGEIEKLKITSGAKFFDKSQNEIFPERNFSLSYKIDKYNFVLKLEKGKDEPNYIIKIDL
jgi:hypothetical protein